MLIRQLICHSLGATQSCKNHGNRKRKLSNIKTVLKLTDLVPIWKTQELGISSEEGAIPEFTIST